ncbi:MAG: bifunctional glutamate N-acetyltransferase/amino-acid acetyltransferase ArgJ [Elusimicrobia bacterium]|nr:bifunctional glutamate N-acetyltransferase/amino-acid acetyltransferase ArgJ [Elusimicrobiota bacterium]
MPCSGSRKPRDWSETVDFPAGFHITGINREEDENKLALITAPEGMKTAGVFTLNTCCAHPVRFSRENLKSPSHKAIIINRGSANAATGKEGKDRMLGLVDALCGRLNIKREEILAASTGVIGKQMNVTERQIEDLLENRGRVEPYDFADAIMTTDTCRKVAWSSFELEGKKVSICGIAKGSGMISPKLATMLAFVLTDADIEKDALQLALERAVNASFNCLIVDADTSTNDTVILAASGKSGTKAISADTKRFDIFYEHLERVCVVLAEQMAADGEGATKMIKLMIRRAPDEEAARKAARAVSSSLLCKTAFYGASPNWGRIVSAIGAAGIVIDIEKLSIYINGVSWIKDGVPSESSMKQVREVLAGSRFELDIDLNAGDFESVCYTCDLSPEYVRINAHYVS